MRKVMHALPGTLPFALALVPHYRTLDTPSLVVIAVVTAILSSVYMLSRRIVRRPDETNFYTTCLSYAGCVLAPLFLFPEHPEFTSVVVVVLAFGDPSAGIAGKIVGGRRLPWNAEKTWAGSVAFVAVAAPLATLAYFLEANIYSFAWWSPVRVPVLVPLWLAVACGASAAVMGAAAESLPTRINDDLRVGVAASVSVIATHYLSVAWLLN